MPDPIFRALIEVDDQTIGVGQRKRFVLCPVGPEGDADCTRPALRYLKQGRNRASGHPHARRFPKDSVVNFNDDAVGVPKMRFRERDLVVQVEDQSGSFSGGP